MLTIKKYDKHKGDIWELRTNHVIVIPVNLQGVMGRGLAKQAVDKCKGLQQWYKDILSNNWKWKHGLPCYYNEDYTLIMFPVKVAWRLGADLDLILKSCKGLVHTMEHWEDTQMRVAFPQVGCGFGELKWHDIKSFVLQALNPIRSKVTLAQPHKSLIKKYLKAFTPGVKRDSLCSK